jgi:Pathogenicity locus
MANPALHLTSNEKANLRRAKIKLAEIHHLDINTMVEILDVSEVRAKMIIGLAEFQSVPSIGPKLAQNLVYHLHIYSLDEIKDRDPALLFDELEQKLGVWIDPCVEDQIRCVVHHANNPDSEKQWHDFTETRKEYRKKYGYPPNRPRKAWYESS